MTGAEVFGARRVAFGAYAAPTMAIHPECARILDDVRALGRRVADGEGMVDIP